MDRSWKIPAGYGFWRGLVRLAAWLLFPKFRLLNSEKLEHSDAALLVVNYPESFRAALLLVAAIDRPVLCLLSPQNLRGAFRSFMGRALGMIPLDSKVEDQNPGFNWLAGALADWGAIAVFAGQSSTGKGQRTSGVEIAARVASEAPKQQIQFATHTLHGILPLDGREAGSLIYVEGPIQDRSSPSEPAENYAQPSEHLVEAVQETLRENVFALEPVEVERFQGDVEDIAHEDIEQEWTQLSNWRQQAEDLHLSGLVKRWIEEQNRVDPGRLVAFRRLVEDYREARRQLSMGRFRLETSGLWLGSAIQVAKAWIESLVGFPVALYGFVNHVPAGVILFLAGLLKKSGKRDPKVEWLLRAFVVLGCYTVQVLLFDLWRGRAAAGYYVLTLPLSGAYLWRYVRLARYRSHLLLLKVTLPGRSVRLQRARKALLEKLEREINLYARSLGLPS